VGILSTLRKYEQETKVHSLNTGTMYDLATGVFVPGKDGKMYLNGGLAMSNGISGRTQTYKSSVALGYAARALNNYQSAEAYIYDSEMTIPEGRLNQLSGRNGSNFDDRVVMYDKSNMGLEELFSNLRELAAAKVQQKKELIRETPFINIDGKFIKSWTPTIVVIDSFSAATSSKESDLYDKVDLGDSKTNMVSMTDGKLKSEFIRQLPNMFGTKGMHFIMTAHIGDNMQLDPYSPKTKDVPMMSSNDKLKHVGTQFQFLLANLLQTRKTTLLQDKDKKCQYPYDFSSDVELQEINAIICRCKLNASGAQINHISSQFFGLQEWLEYYQVIAKSKSALIEGTVKQKLAITDHEFTRHTIRKTIATEPTFRRALEILGQFAYVRNNWNLPEVHKIGYVDFIKRFNESPGLASDILNSTGIWSFNDEPQDKQYLSIIDILRLIAKK